MIRLVTIEREYGSGGADIAHEAGASLWAGSFGIRR